MHPTAEQAGDGSHAETLLRVADLKQYLYCPRIVYYQNVLPVERRVTYKMERGRAEHIDFDRLERRRTLARYRLDEGTRRFHVPLTSERLGLTGVLDLLLETPAGRFPVEYKFSTAGPATNHKYQLVAYALLVEDVYGAPVRTGFVVMAPGRRIHPVPITDNARLYVRRLVSAVRRLIAEGRLPPPTRSTARCRDCEYRNYCLDTARRAGLRWAGADAG